MRLPFKKKTIFLSLSLITLMLVIIFFVFKDRIIPTVVPELLRFCEKTISFSNIDGTFSCETVCK